MTSSTYTGLMQTLSPPEGSEMHDRLQKLQELEQLRREREAQRQQRRAQMGIEPGTSSRLRRAKSTQEADTGSAFTSVRRPMARTVPEFSLFGTNTSNDYGARPKDVGLSTSESKPSQPEDISSIFADITKSFLAGNTTSSTRSRSGSEDSSSSSLYSSSRRRPGLADYRSTSVQYDTSYEPSSRYETSSYSQPASLLGDSLETESASMRARRRAERHRANNVEALTQPRPRRRQNEEYQVDNREVYDNENGQEEGEYQTATEETVEYHEDINHDYEEGEEPKHFIERLKNGSPVHYKRGVGNDYVISTIPSIPPLKKQRPTDADGVPDLVDPLDDDILAVAKDIRATFGIQSPKSGDSQTSEKHFEFNSTTNGNSESNGDFIFTANTGENKPARQSNVKRKSRHSRNLRNSRENLNTDKSNSHLNLSETKDNADDSVIYEIHCAEDDPEDDEGKQLPVSDDFNKSAWLNDHSNTPGKLEKMHEYFGGDTYNGSPVIDRVLDGSRVKKDLDRSFTDKQRSSAKSSAKSPEQQQGVFSSLKSAFTNLVQFDSSESNKEASSSDTTPEKESEKGRPSSKEKRTSANKGAQKTNEKSKKSPTPSSAKKSSGKHKALEKVKGSAKSSDSDNDSFQTASESDSRRTSGASTPTKPLKNSNTKSPRKPDMGMTLSDKLAKLETMTQEKRRKHSVGSESSDGKRPVPSYMSGTSASQSKSHAKSPVSRTKSPASRAKSPAGLAKDVRELKKFVHEHASETTTSTPSNSRRESVCKTTEVTPKKPVAMKEIATQTTDTIVNDAISHVYVCIHCGKSSDQRVESAMSDVATTDGEDTESLDRYETRSETGYSFRSVSRKSPSVGTPKWTFGKNEHRKAPTNSKSYMKGTTSSSLKKSISDSNESLRKTSVPENIYKSKDDVGKGKTSISIVAQRAKDIELAAKKGEEKRKAFSAQRSSSTDRNKVMSDHFSNEKSKLGKSKSVEHMYIAKSTPKQTVDIDIDSPEKENQSNDIPKSPAKTEVVNFSPPKTKKIPPATPPKPKRPVADFKPPVSPTKTDEVFEPAVESKGQFTRLGNNPFIKNDLQRRNSLNEKNEGESVWEKSESMSTSSVESSPRKDSTLKRSDTSTGEKSSLNSLNWSDSGSSESLQASKSSQKGSKSSSLHGSMESLTKSPQRQRSCSVTSQNSMLNLLSPIGTVRNPVTGALETDVDAIYDKTETKETVTPATVEHNEETVEKAHLEFAKKACDALEVDTKMRDSSSDSQKGRKGQTATKNSNGMANGHNGATQMNGQSNNGSNKNNDSTKPKGAAPPPPKTVANNTNSNQSNLSVQATHQLSKPVEKATNSNHSNQGVSVIPQTKKTVVNSNHGNKGAPEVPKQPKVVGQVPTINSNHSNQSTSVVQQPPKIAEKETNSYHGNQKVNQKVVMAPQAPQMLQKLPDVGNHGNQGSAPKQKEDGEDELVKDTRVKFREWDPSKLLSELYKVVLHPENVEDISHQFIGMEGLMEKLPMNKKKATLLKTWKRRFFKAKDGWLHYYETGNRDKPSDSLQLMGGRVEELGQRVLGVDDGRGKYLMVRVPTENEYGQWKVALESQTADNVKATYVRPSPASPPHPKKTNSLKPRTAPHMWDLILALACSQFIVYGQWKVALESQTADNVKATYIRPSPASPSHPKKKVLLIDMGSCGIRAGVLTERPTLPQVFMPSVVAINKQTGEIIVGADALRPTVRKTSTIHYPIRPTNKVDKFNIDVEMMTAIFKKVFSELGVKVENYLVMLSTPQNLADHLKGSLMKILVDTCHVRGVCMVHQCLLALYSYNAMSGIIVDIGERLDILPIYDGLLIEGGVSRQAYGGEKIQDSLYISLLENKYRFNTPVEKLFVRYLTEKGCYVAEDYKAAKAVCEKDPKYKVTVELGDFYLPEGAHQNVTLDHGFFKAPEGFFNTDLWEMDYKNLQKQIFAAIQQCPMDARKQMYRSVYLSGGVTMVPGFADRLQVELKKLAPPSVQVEVHASPQRYHAAYLGASSVAGMDVFEMSCVMADEWRKLGVKACKKWGM